MLGHHAKMRMLLNEIRPTRMLATHAHAFALPRMQRALPRMQRALPRMQRAQRACSAKDVVGRVGREKPVQAIAANRQRVVSCKRTRDSAVRGISEQSGGQHAAGSEQQAAGSRQCRQQAAGSAHHASEQRGEEDDAQLVVRPSLLVGATDHAEHRLPRLQGHDAHRVIEQACTKSGQRAVSCARTRLRASDARCSWRRPGTQWASVEGSK